MFKREFHRQSYIFLICALSFMIPLYRFVIPYFIALLILNYLLEGNFREKVYLLLRNRSRRYLVLFSVLYLVYLIGLIYTSNFYGQEGGLFDLQVKLSLLIFPVMFATLPENILSPAVRMRALQFFLAGCLISVLICTGISIAKYTQSGSTYEFYYTRISYFSHPSYFSQYIDFAIVILLYFLIRDNGKENWFGKSWKILLIGIFMVFIFALSSKAGLMGMIAVFFATILYLMYWKKSFLKGIGLAIAVSVSIFLLFKLLPNTSSRMRAMKAVIAHKQTDESTAIDESVSERVLIWRVSWELIKEHFIFGVGTGDLKNEILKKYEEYGYNRALELRLNAHNQYMQTFISVGIIGFLTLLLSLLLPMVKTLKTEDYIYFLFLLLIIFNFLVESMLETQAGVVFYAYFNALLFGSSCIGACNKVTSTVSLSYK